MKRGVFATGFIAAALCAQLLAPVASAAPAARALAAHRPGVVLVGFVPGASASDRAAALRAVGAVSSEQLSPLAPDARIVRLGGMAVEAAIVALSNAPGVRYAEPDYVVDRVADADDPGYATNIGGATTWGLYGPSTSPNTNTFGSGAGQVWAAGYRGSASIYVGDIDTGIQITHPDLNDNIWTNPGEVAGNGIDDDGNGYVDDVNGWDFYYGDKTVYDSSTYDDHGTHTAGTIGAEGNNGAGVPGVNWDVTIIPAKFLGPQGGYISDAARAVDYLTALKTRYGLNLVATNNSWGGGGFSQSFLDAVNRGGDQNIIFVAAAGNSSRDNDATANYPSNYQCIRQANGTARNWDCVVAVAALTSTGGLAYYSDWGATTVDLGAPGSSVLSTLPPNTYGSYSGTSMATPHVTGALALCASMGGLVGSGLRQVLIDAATATPTTSLAGLTVTGGRLNIPAMQSACTGVAPVSIPTYVLSVTAARTTTSGVQGGGTVTTNPNVLTCAAGSTCTATVGGTVTLTATPATGSAFSGWSGACSGSSLTCSVSMSAARTVTATFRPATYNVSLSVSRPVKTSPSVTISTTSGTSWSVPSCTSTCSNSLLVYTTTVVFRANPATGAMTYTWGGACSGTVGNTCTLTVDAAKSASIRFTK